MRSSYFHRSLESCTSYCQSPRFLLYLGPLALHDTHLQFKRLQLILVKYTSRLSPRLFFCFSHCFWYSFFQPVRTFPLYTELTQFFRVSDFYKDHLSFIKYRWIYLFSFVLSFPFLVRPPSGQIPHFRSPLPEFFWREPSGIMYCFINTFLGSGHMVYPRSPFCIGNFSNSVFQSTVVSFNKPILWCL